MKTLLLSAALAVAIATPALARPPSHRGLYGVPFYRNPQDDLVIVRGRIVGQDPDPNVRLSIRRDAEEAPAR